MRLVIPTIIEFYSTTFRYIVNSMRALEWIIIFYTVKERPLTIPNLTQWLYFKYIQDLMRRRVPV